MVLVVNELVFNGFLKKKKISIFLSTDWQHKNNSWSTILIVDLPVCTKTFPVFPEKPNQGQTVYIAAAVPDSAFNS